MHSITNPVATNVVPFGQPRGEPDALTARVLDELDYGLMLVDASDGRLLMANRPARLECAEGRALRSTGGRLGAARPADASTLTLALFDAARGRRTQISLGADDAQLTLAVIPMSLAGERPGALINLGRRRLCEQLSVQMYGRRHGLTAAENRVLQALCAGSTTADIAGEFGVTEATVRSQVAAIRGKTEAGSIRELMCRVAALPPIVPALREALAA